MAPDPTRFENRRYAGDKATMVVYDLHDPLVDPAIVDELLAGGRLLAFGPDTLPEARNRCYRLFKPRRRRIQG